MARSSIYLSEKKGCSKIEKVSFRFSSSIFAGDFEENTESLKGLLDLRGNEEREGQLVLTK